MATILLSCLLTGIGLSLVLFLFAVPWLAFLDFGYFKAQLRRPASVGAVLGGVAGAGVLFGMLLYLWRDRDTLSWVGRTYGSFLQVELVADFVVLVLGALLLVWPKGAAVGLAAFREGLRQPMFWFFTILGIVLLLITPIVPYFTFGEDFKMVKELGFSVIMLFSAAFGVLAAAMSISEEIEGRTAVTLMSKPVSRRQFLLGKFLGILMAAVVMAGALAWVFDWVVIFKPYFDKETPPPPPLWLEQAPAWVARLGDIPSYLMRGTAWWFSDSAANLPGTALGFCQAMVLIAIAVALATRLPMIVNVVSCLVVFFLGHLTPLMVQVSQRGLPLVRFMAGVFDTVLPGLEFFDVGPAVVRDTPPPPGEFAVYVGSAALYAVLYTAIALLFGLILFEDRDLA